MKKYFPRFGNSSHDLLTSAYLPGHYNPEGICNSPIDHMGPIDSPFSVPTAVTKNSFGNLQHYPEPLHPIDW